MQGAERDTATATDWWRAKVCFVRWCGWRWEVGVALMGGTGRELTDSTSVICDALLVGRVELEAEAEVEVS